MALKVKDIAEMLKVSSATVSLVLNNKPGVSDETRRKVLKTIEELGFGTNILSKPALNSNRNIRFVIYKKHGMVVSDTPFFSALMEGIDREARSEGYNLVVSYINEKDGSKPEILRILEDNPRDGLLLLATEMDRDDLQPFKQLKVPILILDSCCALERLDTVKINNFDGAYAAARCLIDNGHTEIGYLHSSVWIRNFDERRDGFLKALDDHGIKVNRKYILNLGSTLEGAYRDMSRHLQSDGVLPTAFFAANDIIALGAIKAMKEKGVVIPDDVSIVGFDDMPFCEMADPPLTTVRVFKQRTGMIAVRRLIEKIEEDVRETVKIEVNTELIERNSVRKRI